MKTIKSVKTKTFSITLYEFSDGEYSVIKTFDGLEIPSLISKDLGMANAIFDLWFNELTNEVH